MTPDEAYEILHSCRYCDGFTGDNSTGCAGRSGLVPCGQFALDRITMPRWAKEYTYLFEDEDD